MVDSKDLPVKYQSEQYIDQPDSIEDDTMLTIPTGDLDDLPMEGIDMKQYLTNIEISLIEQALTKTNNVVARAATMLKMRRTTLVEKMRKYEIERLE